MTRQDILDEYKVDEHGIIRNPGKFEGEMLYAPYFYDLIMNGDGDVEYDCSGCEIAEGGNRLACQECDRFMNVLKVDPEDIDKFPELEGAKEVTLYEDSQGFVYVSTK